MVLFNKKENGFGHKQKSYTQNGSAKSDDKNNIRQIAGELEASIRGLEFALSQGAKKVVIFHDYLGIAHHATGFWSRREESSINY